MIRSTRAKSAPPSLPPSPTQKTPIQLKQTQTNQKLHVSLFYIFPVKSVHFIDAQNNSKPHHSKSRHLSDNSNCNFGQLNNVFIDMQLYGAEFFTLFYKLPKGRLCSWSGCRVPDTSMSDGEMRKAPFERAFARKSGWSGLIMAVVV